MAVEIERKFLVTSGAWRSDARAGERIRQGWLVRDPERTVRVRRRGDRAYLTVKGPGGLARPEFEWEIPSADADALLDTLCLPGQIDKTRFEVDVDGHGWEVDVFHAEHHGLVVAEIELESTDETFVVPAWAGLEVTGDDRYTNAVLSRPGTVTPPH
jgi:adenylate cyclase